MKVWKIIMIMAIVLIGLYAAFNWIMFGKALQMLNTPPEVETSEDPLSAIFGTIFGTIAITSMFSAMASSYLTRAIIYTIIVVVLIIILLVI